jgi:hypothetical protein
VIFVRNRFREMPFRYRKICDVGLLTVPDGHQTRSPKKRITLSDEFTAVNFYRFDR